jgi:hypothetical protein
LHRLSIITVKLIYIYKHVNTCYRQLTVSNDQNGIKKVIKRSETAMKSLGKLIKRSGTDRNDHETVENAQKRSGMVRNGERSNALERIVENGHVHASKTKEKL